MATPTDASAMERELVLRRRLAAPRELVFKAFTDPEHLMRWWGPHHFTAPECAVDLRVGGALRIVMEGPNGMRFPMTGIIDELEAPERFAYSFETGAVEGHPALRGRNAIRLEAVGLETELTVTARAEGLLPEAAMMLAGMQEGWTQSLDKLASFLA